MKVYNMTAKLKQSGTKIEIGSIRDWKSWPMYHDNPELNAKAMDALSIETPGQAEQRITKSHKTVLDVETEHRKANSKINRWFLNADK